MVTVARAARGHYRARVAGDRQSGTEQASRSQAAGAAAKFSDRAARDRILGVVPRRYSRR